LHDEYANRELKGQQPSPGLNLNLSAMTNIFSAGSCVTFRRGSFRHCAAPQMSNTRSGTGSFASSDQQRISRVASIQWRGRNQDLQIHSQATRDKALLWPL
jgi:hypothetical protein